MVGLYLLLLKLISLAVASVKFVVNKPDINCRKAGIFNK